jgi:hypothetical protein
MYGAQQLKLRYQSASYRAEYDNWVMANDGDEAKMFDPAKRWLPDPSTVRLRKLFLFLFLLFVCE